MAGLPAWLPSKYDQSNRTRDRKFHPGRGYRPTSRLRVHRLPARRSSAADVQRKFVDPSAIEASECIRDHENCVGWVAHHACESLVKIFRLTHAEWLHPNPNCPSGVCGCLVSERHAQIVYVPEHRPGSPRTHPVFE